MTTFHHVELITETYWAETVVKLILESKNAYALFIHSWTKKLERHSVKK